MPRDGSGQYSVPVGTDVVPDTTVESSKYNLYVHDVETDLNLPRPISAGGTGADNVADAMSTLGGELAKQVITNYDTDPFQAGSFYSAISATAAPVASHAFIGICYTAATTGTPPTAVDLVIEARDITDTTNPGALWIRQKKASVWSAWVNTNPVSVPGAPGLPPPSAADNAFWWDPTRGKLFYRYNDGNSAQWVEAVAVPDIDPNMFVEIAGDSMVGPLLLAADPTVALGAATKQYADVQGTKAVRGVNVLINGDFRINQGGYVSASVLAAGAYGHDQWKAGAAGGDYSFTQLASSTQVTIASGKSIIQPIEDVKVVGGSYVLSWTGTAQARVGVNTLVPSGAYAVSPLLVTGQAAGTAMSVEFNTGVLGLAKLESGTTATPFVVPDYSTELAACRRYYQVITSASGAAILIQAHSGAAGTGYSTTYMFPVAMRAVPTVSTRGAWSFTNLNAVNFFPDTTGLAIQLISAATGLVGYQAPAGGAWIFTARL